MPLNNGAALQQWGCLKTMRRPHNKEAASKQWGCLRIMWLSHNNKAASQQWICLTTMRLPHKNVASLQDEATSQQWSRFTTMWLPHSIENCRCDFLHCLTVAKVNQMQVAFNWPIRVIVLWVTSMQKISRTTLASNWWWAYCVSLNKI